jgi:integrase
MAGAVYSYKLTSGAVRWCFVIDQEKVWDAKARRFRRQQLKRSGFARKLDAERALTAEASRIDQGTAPSLADRQATLSEYLDEWLRVARKADGEAWRPSTVTTYRTSVERYIRPGLGAYRLTELRRSHIETWAGRVRDGAFGQGGPLSRRTVHQAFSTLRTVLGQAIVDGKITVNPCQQARVPGPGRRPPKFWEPEEVARFLAHVTEAEPGLAPAFMLAAWHGPRRGEVCGLQWADLDLTTGTLAIRRNVTEADRQAWIGPTKTERGVRTIQLADEVTAALRAHRRRQPFGEWVFTGADGGMLWPHTLTQHFAALARQVKPSLPPLHLHGLRHSAASNALMAGIPAKVVADMLGHDVATLLSVYAHVLPRQREDSAAVIGRLYAGNRLS